MTAARVTGELLGRSEGTIREWWYGFIDNDCTFSGTLQGAYQESSVLWSNEELSESIWKYVQENAALKDHPNMTAMSFTTWVNIEPLLSQVLKPRFPRNISVETARKWLHELGFFIVDRKDGHEREDIVKYRKRFLRKVAALGFLNKANAPTLAAGQSLPAEIDIPSDDPIKKNGKVVVLFHFFSL